MQEKRIIHDLFFSEIESFHLGFEHSVLGTAEEFKPQLYTTSNTYNTSNNSTVTDVNGENGTSNKSKLKPQAQNFQALSYLQIFSSFYSFFQSHSLHQRGFPFFNHQPPRTPPDTLNSDFRSYHMVITLKNTSSTPRQKTFFFDCLELNELAELIEFYSPHHATWKKSSTASFMNTPLHTTSTTKTTISNTATTTKETQLTCGHVIDSGSDEVNLNTFKSTSQTLETNNNDNFTNVTLHGEEEDDDVGVALCGI